MNDLVEMPERVPTLSPIVTPLPFYRQPLACRQLAFAALVVLALLGGALRWHQLLMSVSDTREPRQSAPPQAELLRLDLLLIEPVPIEPAPPLELVVLDIHVVEDSAPVSIGPCL